MLCPVALMRSAIADVPSSFASALKCSVFLSSTSFFEGAQ